jgi:hypothetical protein
MLDIMAMSSLLILGRTRARNDLPYKGAVLPRLQRLSFLFGVLLAVLLGATGPAQPGERGATIDVPDQGPPLRHFDAKKHGKCIQSSVARKKKLSEGYKMIAEEYKTVLKDLGDGNTAPKWLTPTS